MQSSSTYNFMNGRQISLIQNFKPMTYCCVYYIISIPGPASKEDDELNNYSLYGVEQFTTINNTNSVYYDEIQNLKIWLTHACTCYIHVKCLIPCTLHMPAHVDLITFMHSNTDYCLVVVMDGS